ncbi:MAG: ABC transporter ATP-binding protein [Roseiflexaceae bacterium]
MPKPFAQQIQTTLKLLRLAVQLIWAASPRLLVAVLLLLAVQAAIAPLQLALSKAVLDRLAFDLRLAANVDPLVAALPLSAWIIFAAASVAISSLFQPFSATFQTIIGDRLTANVAEQIMLAANRWQGIARFEDPTFADDLARARNWTDRFGLELLLAVANLIIALLMAIGVVIVLARLSLLAPALLLLAAIPQMARRWDFVRRTRGYLYIQTPKARQLEYSRAVMLNTEPAKDVRLYGLGPFFRQRYDTLFDETIGEVNHMRRRSVGPMAFANALATAAAGVIYVYLVWLIMQRQYTLGDLVLYGGAATVLQAQLINVGFSIGFLPVAFGLDLPGLFRILDAPPDLPLAPNPRPAPRPIRAGIVFEHVAFTYPGNAEPVLRDVSFAIRPGECVALVGHNGAGKTTIVKLLLRLYDPTAGRILLDGIDLREYDLDDLRRELSAIFQDFVRYELTAGENIGVGRVAQRHDIARLHDTAARGGAATLIEQLPQGLDTLLGREFGGRELSGGEWQKLALARAFMRDSQLLVLDEPTAAVDVQTEYDIYTRFHDLTRDRMTLLISHRFSTVRMADRIVFIKDGQVAESGSHTELIARAGVYARLFDIQASTYRDL